MCQNLNFSTTITGRSHLEKDSSQRISTMSNVLHIPGMYFDPVKKRYFKIEKNAASPHQYNDTVIRAKKEEDKRAFKRARISQKETQRLGLPYPSHLALPSKLHQRTRTQIQQDVDHLCISSMRQTRRLRYSVPSTFTKACVHDDGDKIILSDLNNVYSVERYFEDSEDPVFPHLIWNRVNKSTSILRNLDLLHQNVVARTWYGSLDEPSEIELLSLNDNLEISGTRTILSTKRESFNTSSFNSSTNLMTVCTTKSVWTTNIETASPREEFTLNGDALSIDHKDAFVSYIGLRSGMVKIWDNREKFTKGKSHKPHSLRSITNIKFTDPNELVCSSIGSKLHLYDTRWGLEECVQDFHTIKNVVNVFGETISVDHNNGYFMLNTKDLVEIYNTRSSNPLKIITNHDRNGRHILGSTWDTTSKTRDSELITLSNDSIEIYQ